METKEKKPIYKKWWFWVIIVLVLFIIIGVIGGKSDKTETDDPSSKATVSDSDSESEDGNNADSDSQDKKEAYEIGEGQIRIWQSSIGSEWISVAIPVKNTGTENLFLSTGTIDIENADGTLAKTLNMVSVYPQVLLPGETAYYFEETTLEESLSAEGLKVQPHVDIKKAKVDCIRFETSEISVKDTDYYGAKIVGRIENTSDKAQSMVYIVANIFDSKGELLAQQFTILDNDLQPGEKIGFETSNLGYEFHASDVASYEVFAFPNQYQF